MAAGEYKFRILEVLTLYPEGISYNKLYKELSKAMARDTFNKYIRELVEEGVVERKPEEKGRRKVIYRLKEPWKKFREWAGRTGAWLGEEWRGIVDRFERALRDWKI